LNWWDLGKWGYSYISVILKHVSLNLNRWNRWQMHSQCAGEKPSNESNLFQNPCEKETLMPIVVDWIRLVLYLDPCLPHQFEPCLHREKPCDMAILLDP